MARRRINPHAVISLMEAERGIYIDCEGFAEQSPALIGILIGDNLEQVLLDQELEPIAIAKGHRMSSLTEVAMQLAQQSEREERPIIAYSQHELNLLMKYARIDISKVYRDARMIAKRWKNILHPDVPLKSRSLKDFLEFIGFTRLKYLGYRKSTKRLNAVREMLRRKGSFDALTPVVKAQWTKLLVHNAIDCRGMRALVLRAASELESRQRVPVLRRADTSGRR
jgi:predicted nuclease of restriction endonuclease-like RecB superfamily